ncbi:MAG TPA: SRPBCC family protein [Polyangiaceae bacterium LLY-WYZ-15_(1-7)]|nr:SRPBCC family protein [Polyangiaceae bacterium LLY-WYZ-15_(1-7)]
MPSLRPLALALLLGATASPALAQAPPPPPPADEAPLRGLIPRELDVLAPHLDRGPVVLAQFRPDPRLMPAVVFATRIDAPVERVAEAILHPERYPEFMPALDEIAIESRQGPQIAYSWQWQIALFTLRGRNVMTAYPPHPTRGLRVDVLSTGGDMGEGRMSWRVRPDGPGRSLLVLTSRVDMRDANYIADRLASGGTSVQRSINVALTTVMALGTKRRAEGAARGPAGVTEGPLAPRELDLAALAPVLARGDLVFLELDGDRLDRVGVVARASTGVARVREVMLDPEEFGRSLVHGSRARVVERTDAHVDFDWGIPLPLLGVEGRMRLFPSEGAIRVEGVRGSLAAGRWTFDTTRFSWGEAVIVGWGRFDPADTSRLVRRLIADDSDFSHGLAVATQIMVARGLRRSATR